MSRPLRLSPAAFLWACACCWAGAACGPSHLAVGRDYAARANLPVAVEYFAAGLAASPADEALRADLILAQETYKRDATRVIDSLVDNGLYRQALDRLSLLSDAAALARGLQVPADDPAALEAQRQKLLERATTQLEKDLDERAARGVAQISDLETCRQLETIAGGDTAVSRRCDSLLDRFKLFAAVEAAAGAGTATAGMIEPVAAALRTQRAQLLEVVARGHEKVNARLSLGVAQPTTVDVDWHVGARRALRELVPKLDAKGKPIVETVEVKLTKKEIAELKEERRALREAKRKGAGKGKPPPEEKEEPIPTTKRVQKQVYEEVEGELTIYRASRAVTVPYSIVLENLRDDRLQLVISGELSAESTSAYHEFKGDERARKPVADAGPEGKRRAAPLEDEPSLLRRALADLPGRIAKDTVAHIE